MECTILPNTMFDDGSIEARCFIVCTADDTFYTDFERLSAIKGYQGVLDLLRADVLAGKGYMDCRLLDVKTSDGVKVLEIQWDGV